MSDLLPLDSEFAPIEAPTLRGRVEARHDAEEVFDALASDLMGQALHCVGKYGEFHLALSGGKTPFPFYEKLMIDPRFRAIPWSSTHLWMVDERRIGFDNDLNNYKHINEILVEHSGIPAENVHPMPVEDATPDVTYERALREALGRRPQMQQRLDWLFEDTSHEIIQFWRLFKEEQANELNKNLKVFVNLNQEEKILRQELFDKQEELKYKEKQFKIASVVHKTRIGHLRREEREIFIGNFA
jgi:hypothetical protein